MNTIYEYFFNNTYMYSLYVFLLFEFPTFTNFYKKKEDKTKKRQIEKVIKKPKEKKKESNIKKVI